MAETVSERFWSKAAVGGADECWLWQASKDSIGYGRFRLNGKARKANRLALMLQGHVEPFDGACAIHSCDNRACVNPAHLRWGTQAENMTDCTNKGRNSNATLTPEQVREIRQLPHLKHREVAALYGVCRDTIRCLRRGRTWRHLRDV